MERGHGNHWGALTPYDVELLIEELLPAILANGTLLSRGEIPGSNGTACEVAALTWPATDLQGLCLCTRSAGQASFELASAYPFAVSGVQHRLTIEQIEVLDGGIEALLHVSIEGAALTFFDTRYFENRLRYREGQECEFVLAGLAYALTVTRPMPIVIDNPKTVSAMRNVPGDSPEASKPIVVRTENAAILFPASDAGDDFAFQARVKEVHTFEFNGQPGWRFRSTVLRAADQVRDIDIEIYAVRAVIDGSPPSVGDDITGNIWLQGYLCR